MTFFHPRNFSAAFRFRPGTWRVALLMTAVLFGLLLLNNGRYLFATKLYESADQAADSLLVREAKHHFLLHGHYSRWHFYHPGPALIDTLAVGEALFYDGLHVVPTPYNGQLLMLCLVLTLAFSLALAIFARQLGAGAGGHLFFLPLALLFALWHYGMLGAMMFLDAWPAFPPVAVFLCMVVAATAVASGSGRELPVLVGAGGWLVHNNASLPIFVVPLTSLAYAGLLATCWRQSGGRPAGTRKLPGNLAAGWRAFPWAHRVAAGLLLLFVLPLALDGLHGRESNLADLLRFVRGNRQSEHSWSDSWRYFLTFGGYDTFRPGYFALEDQGDTRMLSYLGVHWRAYALWLAALTGGLALFVVGPRSSRLEARPEGASGNRRFLGWFYTILALSCGLTLYWGVNQKGPMLFYNAFLNYSIYYCLALGLAASGAVALMAWTASSSARRLRPILAALLWLAVAGTVIFQAGRFRTSTFGTPDDAVMADTVKRAEATLPAGAVCFLDWNLWHGWLYAASVMLELERSGHPVRVNDNWAFMLGAQRTLQREGIRPSTPLVHWMVTLQSEDPGRLSRWPLLAGFSLDMRGLPTGDPAGQHLSFLPGGNYHQFALCGWSDAGGPWSWSDQWIGLLVFRPLPLPPGATAGVDLLISAWTSLPPGQTKLQRSVIEFNGVALGTVVLPSYGPNLPLLRVRISAALWQDAVTKDQARLQFRFPDAQAPIDVGVGADFRRIGGGFRSLEFRPVFSDVVGDAPSSEESLAAVMEADGSGDGWCGPVTKFRLPGEGAGPDLVRLRGQVPAAFGYRYPYRLICHFFDGRSHELSIKRAGDFDEWLEVPLPSGATTREMQMLAPQTCRPAEHAMRSSDDRELSVHLDRLDYVTAANPLLVERGSGWYGLETNGSMSWRWTNGQSTLSVLAERTGTLVLETSASCLLGENAIEVLVDGGLATVSPCSAEKSRTMTWRLPVAMGLHWITLRSRLPPVQPPGDSRLLALKLQYLHWWLEP